MAPNKILDILSSILLIYGQEINKEITMIRCPSCKRVPNKFELAAGRCSAPVGAEGYCDTRLPVTKELKVQMSMAVAYRSSAAELVQKARKKVGLAIEDLERCGEKAVVRKLKKVIAALESAERDIDQSFNNVR